MTPDIAAIRGNSEWPSTIPIFEGTWTARPESPHRASRTGGWQMTGLFNTRRRLGLPDLMDVQSGQRVAVTSLVGRPEGRVQECFANGLFSVRLDGETRGTFVLLSPGEFEVQA